MNQEQAIDSFQKMCVFTSNFGKFQYGCSSYIDSQADFYICPSIIIDLKSGILLFDIENQLSKHHKINVICTEQQKEILKTFISISFFGSQSNDYYQDYHKEFHTTYTKQDIPNLFQETKLFYQLVLNNDKLQIDQYIDFLVYDKIHNSYHINNDLIVVLEKTRIVLKENNKFLFAFNKEESEQQLVTILKNLNFHTINKRKSRHLSVSIFKIEELANIQQNNDNDNLNSESNFVPPLFGVTPLPHPTISNQVQGIILWINGRAALVDPPIFTKEYLQKLKITPRLIDWVILTNTFTRIDQGLMQRLIQSQRLEIITTLTILKAFLQKYSLLTGHQPELMRKLVKFKPILIGAIINLNGAVLRFHYGFSYGPTLGFEIGIDGKQIYYSGCNYFNPKEFYNFSKRNYLSDKRAQSLSNIKWVQNLIYASFGNQIWQTSWKIYQQFPDDIKAKLTIIHSSRQELLDNSIEIQPHQMDITIGLEIKKNKALDYLSKLDVLSQMEIFETLSMRNLRDLLEVAQIEQFSAGQLIIKEGTIGWKWYIILKGTAQIETKNQSWSRTFSVGDYFGEAALIESETQIRRRASVKAITEVIVMTLQKHDFWCTFGKDQESVGTKILQKMMQLYASRKTQGFEALLQNKGLSELHPAQQMQFEMMMKEKHIAEGQLLWKETEEAYFVCLLYKGSMRLTNTITKEQVQIKEGMFVGDVEAILLDTVHITQLEVLQTSLIFQIEKGELISYLKRNPGFFITYGQSKYFA